LSKNSNSIIITAIIESLFLIIFVINFGLIGLINETSVYSALLQQKSPVLKYDTHEIYILES